MQLLRRSELHESLYFCPPFVLEFPGLVGWVELPICVSSIITGS